MKYLVFSFLLSEPIRDTYEIRIDKGAGLEYYRVEHEGNIFVVVEDSPIKFISNYCEENGYEIFQVVEEDGYHHLRFYLKKLDATQSR